MYDDRDIRDYYNQAVQKIKTNDKRKRSYVTGVMTERIMDISGRKERKVPLGQAARIRVSPNVVRRTNNNFRWSNMFGQTNFREGGSTND